MVVLPLPDGEISRVLRDTLPDWSYHKQPNGARFLHRDFPLSMLNDPVGCAERFSSLAQESGRYFKYEVSRQGVSIDVGTPMDSVSSRVSSEDLAYALTVEAFVVNGPLA